MARLIGITYASLVIGKDQTDSSYNLTDRFKVAAGYTEFSITFDVLVSHGTRATFLTACAALEAAYEKPDQALTVVLGSSTRYSLDPAANTGFNARATWQKLGSEDDTANSCRYRCGVTVQLPADLSGRSGRQSSSVSVDVTASGQRTVVIEGTYTALTTNSATAQYEAAADTYVSGVLTAVGGTYEHLTRGGGFVYDDQNKVLRFRRVYREILYRQSTAGTDDSSIKDPQIRIERVSPPNDSDPQFGARPLERLRVSYQAWIDSSVTGASALESLYASTIRPLLLAELSLVAGTTVVVSSETPAYMRYQNQVAASIEAMADAGGAFYQATLEIQDVVRHGKILTPVWSGNPFARDLYEGPATHRKVAQRFTVGRTSATFDPRLGIPQFSGFVELEQLRSERRGQFGIYGDQIPYTAVTHTFVFERADVDGQGGGGTTTVRSNSLGFA